ncbi:MAG: tRNA (cytidine(34)-2'-O)-methyltransferase [Bdellovibrionota bacterium]
MSFNVVLVEPQIPPNTGNIGRLCIATHSKFHLVEPLGFDITEKAVRRAGLDYWKHVDLTVHKSYAEFRASLPAEARLWFFTKFAKKTLYQAEFKDGDYLVFGKETKGLLPEIHEQEPPERMLRIPMPGDDIVRSLNLAGSVHIALYEALRQTTF